MRNPEKISARRRTLLGERPGAFAEAKYLRMSASKVRRVIDLVRGRDVNQALAILRYAPQAAAVPAYKALASAIANAEHQEELEADDLFISAIFADEGVTLRRMRARGKGSADRIFKRGAHLTVVVEPKPESEPMPARQTRTGSEPAEAAKTAAAGEAKATKSAQKSAAKPATKAATKTPAKAPAKTAAKAPAKTAAKAPAKTAAKAPAKTAAKAPAKTAAKAPAKTAAKAPATKPKTTDQKKEA